MAASVAAIGQDRNDAPQWFTSNVRVDGTFTQNGATVQNGAETVNGTSTVNGNFVLGTAGNGIQVKEGTNATMGTLVLNGATPVVVSTTAVTANSRIFLTTNVAGGTPAYNWVSARSAGVSFSVTGTAGDTSTVAWLIVNPAP